MTAATPSDAALTPCPFCGAQPLFGLSAFHTGFASCKGTAEHYHGLVHMTLEQWNRRASDPLRGEAPANAADEQALLALCEELDHFNRRGSQAYSRSEMAALLRKCVAAMTDPKAAPSALSAEPPQEPET